MRTLLLLVLLAAAALPQEGPPELHKIYVPYKQLDEVLGTDTERVMVPYKEFMELWKLKYGPQKADQPLVPFMVESADYEGRVADGVASFTATIGIEVFEDGWQRIPLGFSKVAFEEVTVDGKPGVLTPAPEGYDLLLRGKGRHEVAARFVAGIARGKEYATSEFDLPPVPLHKLAFRVPGKDTEISLEPARAHTVRTEGDETLLLAFLGPQKSVKLTWRFKPEEVAQEPPLVFATDSIDVRVEERVVRGEVAFDLQVLRTPAREFTVRIPEKLQVLEVNGAHLKSWGFLDEQRRQLKVTLHEAVAGNYTFTVGFEGPVDVPGTLPAPMFRVEQAARERGFLRVMSAEGVGLRPAASENVFQVDLSALPERIRGGERALGFRFPALPWSLALATERIAPRVSVVTRARLLVEKRRLRLVEDLHFTVERAGIFGLRLRVPPGIQVPKVGDPSLVENLRETPAEDGGKFFDIELKGRRIGAFTLQLEGEAPLDLAQGTLPVPLVKVLGVDREEGTLGVFMDPGIKAEATTAGVVPLEPQEYRAEDNYNAPLPLAFAWRWRGHDAAVTFAVEARKPKVTCDVAYSLQAEEGRVRVRVDLGYQVQYTGVETFRFRVPKSLVAKLKVDGRNIREKPSADDPVEEGKEPTATFTVSLQSPALGQVALWAEYDDVFPEPLKVNGMGAVAIPAILPLDVESANTYVAVRKAPTIKVGVAEGRYEQIDASELPQALRGDDVFLALRRFDEPDAFRLELTKLEYQPVADLVVRHAHLKTVVADESHATTTAFFEILNNDRQFLAVRLPAGSEVLDLRVAGKPEKPRLGAEGVLLVRLETGLRKDASFEVAIAYTHPAVTEGSFASAITLDGPRLPAVEGSAKPFQALLTWEVYYPSAWQVNGFDGNVEPADEDASWLRRAIRNVGSLLQPVEAEGPGAPRTARAIAFKDIVPTPVQRDSTRRLFTNGVGDGTLVIHYNSLTARVLQTLLALSLGIVAVAFAGRRRKPWQAGGAVAVLALVLLAFAGPGWAAFWNGLLAGAVLATLGLYAARVRVWRKA